MINQSNEVAKLMRERRRDITKNEKDSRHLLLYLRKKSCNHPSRIQYIRNTYEIDGVGSLSSCFFPSFTQVLTFKNKSLLPYGQYISIFNVEFIISWISTYTELKFCEFIFIFKCFYCYNFVVSICFN